MAPRAAVILAAGQGTRMKSPLPKVLHRLAGRTLVDHAIDVALELGCEKVVVVVGAHSPAVGEHVRRRLGEGATAIQDPPLGTAHAVLAARQALAGFSGQVIVTAADTPLMDAAAIQPVLDLSADLAVLGFEAADPFGYGRLILDDDQLLAVIEEKEATDAQRAVRHCNSGVIACDADQLFGLLDKVGNANAKGEYYLTDIVCLANRAGLSVRAAFAPEDAMMGVNSQAQLAQAEAIWQKTARLKLMEAGVAMSAPDTVFLAHDTMIAGGVVIEPNVVFGPGVEIETGAFIRAFSHLEGCIVRSGAIIGPYARLRPGADIGEEAHIGNFVEVKRVKVGKGAKANHLTYLGDGTVGARANIGAGTIFCNYDGFEKFETHIGEDALIGSDTALVAPVRVGDRAMTGSGSVITQDVPDDALALARGIQANKEGWAAKFRGMKLAKKKAAP